MNQTSRPSRRRKGRILFVDSAEPGASLTLDLDPPPLHTRNIFEAIGEITSAPAHAPVATVVISTRALPANGTGALEALRRTDPTLNLYLVTEADTPPDQIESAARWCDRVVSGPIEARALLELLDSDESLDPSPSISAQAAPETPRMRKVEEELVPETTALSDIAIPEARPKPEQVIPGIETVIPTPHRESEVVREPLGDTDLINAAMTDPGGLLETALLLVRQQTGWSDLEFTTETPAPDSEPSTVIESHQQRFGYLSAPTATEDELERWGNWLAQWLLLDHHYRNFRRLAYQDELTGAWNRRYFYKFLNETLRKASAIRRTVSVLVFDIDNFKRYNDEFGHDSGDVILIETVRLLKSEIRPCDRVCRIGGDEFAVVFADLDGPREVGSSHPETVEKIARRFQLQICKLNFPKLGLDAPGTLSISGGLASYPWDGSDPDSLLRHADQLALQSKRSGKNALTFGPGATHLCNPTENTPDLEKP